MNHIERSKAWRSGEGGRLWLSMLIDTMEQLSRRDFDDLPCDESARSAVKVQLSRPVFSYPPGTSPFSRYN